MKRLFLLAVIATSISLFSCQKEKVQSQKQQHTLLQQSKYLNYGTDQKSISSKDAQVLSAKKKGGRGNAPINNADFVHAFLIHDSTVTWPDGDHIAICWTPNPAYQPPIPFGANDNDYQVVYWQLNHSFGDSTTAVPAQQAWLWQTWPNYLTGYSPNYGFWVDQTSFHGQGVKTYWNVGVAGVWMNFGTYSNVGSAFLQTDF